MTMATSTTASTLRQQGVSLRKTNKPLMEKRRRARINDSLTQLKSLVIQGTKKDSSQFNKLEKADILELTVKYLRNLQTQQQQQIASNANAEPNTSVGKYQDGFMECANEVIRYLGQSHGFSDDIKARVISHLASCIQLANLSKASAAPSIKSNTLVKPNSTVLTTAPNASGQPAAISGAQTQSAQLPNGQIIQIVTSPYQTVSSSALRQPTPSAISSTQFSSMSSTPSPSTAIQANFAQQQLQVPQQQVSHLHLPPTSNPTLSVSPNQAQTQPLSRYTEPLHIQIPNEAFSPVRAQKLAVTPASTHQQQDIPSHLHEPQPAAFSRNNVNFQESPSERVPSLHKDFSTFPSPQSQSSNSTIPSPCFKDQPISPVPFKKLHRSGHQTCHEPQDIKSEPDSRARSYSMTSSSSVESDLASPLNLSRSPEDEYHEQQLNAYYRSLRKYPNPSAYKHQRASADRSPVDFIPTGSNKFDSVMTDGRKEAMDRKHLDYMQMMHEDKHCARNEGPRSRSTSPASSVGEERLWRPW